MLCLAVTFRLAAEALDFKPRACRMRATGQPQKRGSPPSKSNGGLGFTLAEGRSRDGFFAPGPLASQGRCESVASEALGGVA